MEKTKYTGVYFRISKSNDKTFYISYRKGGRGSKQVLEPVGKSSQGMTAAKAAEKAFKQLSQIRENIRLGEGACSIKELRELNQAQVKEAERIEDEFTKKNIVFECFWENEYFPATKYSKKESSVTSV